MNHHHQPAMHNGMPTGPPKIREPPTTVTITTSDSFTFAVEPAVLLISNTYKDSVVGETINLPNMKGYHVDLVLEWCTIHKDDIWPNKSFSDNTKNIPKEHVKDWITDWDWELVKHLNWDKLFGLLYGAVHFDVKSLVDLVIVEVRRRAVDGKEEGREEDNRGEEIGVIGWNEGNNDVAAREAFARTMVEAMIYPLDQELE